MRFKPLLHPRFEEGRFNPDTVFMEQFHHSTSIEEIYDYIWADCGGCRP